MNKKEKILKNIDSIPAMPASTSRLMRLLDDDDDAGIDEISQTIEYNPGLTANVLKIANSAYFSFAGAIGSIKNAVLRLGTKRVFQLVLAVSLSSSIKKPVKGYDLPPPGNSGVILWLLLLLRKNSL